MQGRCTIRLIFILSIFAVRIFFNDTTISKAQDKENYEYDTELTGGVTTATNTGFLGGFTLRFNKKLKGNIFHGIGIEIVNIKHPQEEKYLTSSGGRFIFGKENYLYNMRIPYIREVVFFKKAPERGIQVIGIMAAGPVLGFEIPYFLEVISADGVTTRKEPFDVNKHLQPGGGNIVGKGDPLQGIGNSSIVPGAVGKFGLAFEFGTIRSEVIGLEFGFQADVFIRPIIIMPTTKNYSLFPSSYLTLFFGMRK